MTDTTETDTRTVGSILSAAREARGFSQKEIADQLYLTPSFIEFIDADEAFKIPKQAFVKGYLRTYAKLVNLNGDLIVEKFNADAEQPAEIEVKAESTDTVAAIYFTGPVFKTGLIGLVTFIFVLLIVWYFSSGDEQDNTIAPVSLVEPQLNQEPQPNKQPQQNEIQTLQLASHQVNAGSEKNASENENSIALEAEGNANEMIETVNSLSSTPVSMEALKAQLLLAQQTSAVNVSLPDEPFSVNRELRDTTQYITVDAGGSDELRFVFSGECWLEIEDAEGTQVYADLGTEGNNLTILGSAPFKILFGNAPAVAMSFNGQAYALKSHISNDRTAKLRVGI